MERWFYRDDAEWKAFAERLKLVPCPHCKAVGTLIRHGCLRGYDDCSPPRKTVRARRIFCSNRHRRRGCGRTVSVWVADRVRGINLSTGTLWRFLQVAAASTIVAAMLTAIRPTDCQRSYRTWQRIWARFDQGQSKIRTALSQCCPPPECPPQQNPPPQGQPHQSPPPQSAPPQSLPPQSLPPQSLPPKLPVPVTAKPNRPAMHVLAHLRAAFPDTDPIASFQHTLQTFFV